LCLITDFASERPWTIAEDRSIDAALREMACARVRALFVIRDDAVVGLITAAHAGGKSSGVVERSSISAGWEQVKVRDAMVPWHHVPVLEWRSVCRARVWHMEQYFRNNRGTHVMLVEHIREGEIGVRGLVSRARVERQLGYRL
jgi:hypothetical protein